MIVPHFLQNHPKPMQRNAGVQYDQKLFARSVIAFVFWPSLKARLYFYLYGERAQTGPAQFSVIEAFL